jgi:hypothetical protein
MSAMANNV